jgi:hypothetical protein
VVFLLSRDVWTQKREAAKEKQAAADQVKKMGYAVVSGYPVKLVALVCLAVVSMLVTPCVCQNLGLGNPREKGGQG